MEKLSHDLFHGSLTRQNGFGFQLFPTPDKEKMAFMIMIISVGLSNLLQAQTPPPLTFQKH